MVEIHPLTQVTGTVVQAFERLIPQLSDARPPTQADLEKIVSSPATSILLAYDPAQDDHIIGTLTLVVFCTPTGMHAWIEDVVVDGAWRGRGIGEALTRAGLECAAKMGAAAVDLTSRPSREAANRLYQRLGFQLRHTNLYRLILRQDF
jgi:ribosomal protein S18 acetylase RimI-like enzyme